MNYSDEYGSPKELAYTNFMLGELKRIRREPLPKSSVQQPSTLAIMNRPVELDEQWRNRLLPTKAQAAAVPGAKTLDEAVGWKDRDASQILVVENIRHKGRNSTGDAISFGQSSVTLESKQRAVNAFIYTPPAEITREQKLIASQTYIERIKPIEPDHLAQIVEKINHMPKARWYESIPIIGTIGRLIMGKDFDWEDEK